MQAENVQVVGAALAAGMYPKLLSMDQGGFKTIINQQPVAIVRVERDSCSLVGEVLIGAAPELGQLPRSKVRVWDKLPRVFHHHAEQKALRVGDRTGRRSSVGSALRGSSGFQGERGDASEHNLDSTSPPSEISWTGA
jgi:hypothetical protein